MSGPGTLQLKRKRTEDPPKVLVIEPSNKRAATRLHYVLKSDHQDDGSATQKDKPQQPASDSNAPQGSAAQPAKRFFQLSRDARGTKRKGVDDGVAVLVEKRVKSDHLADESSLTLQQVGTVAPEKSYKRPGRHAAVKPANEVVLPGNAADQQKLDALADYMHDFALDEVRRESQIPRAVPDTGTQAPKVTTPKLSGQRSREIHRQRVALYATDRASKQTEMDIDSSYVYDTYVLASPSKIDASSTDLPGSHNDIGYLIIGDEDQNLWQTYLDDGLGSEDETNSDEEDENAEDYYGADYPEDELDSDDEHGRATYAYRGKGASDDEEWNEDTGAYSDDEYMRVMEPFRNRSMPIVGDTNYLAQDDDDSD